LEQDFSRIEESRWGVAHRKTDAGFRDPRRRRCAPQSGLSRPQPLVRIEPIVLETRQVKIPGDPRNIRRGVIEQLEGDKANATSTSHRKKLQEKQDDLKRQQAKLNTFEEKLKHFADQKISLDFDVGVKVNYGKSGDLLAESKIVNGGYQGMNRKPDASESIARIWCIRAGKGGEAHDLFLGEKVIALADAGIGDLTKLEGSRKSFYAAYRNSHPEATNVGTAGIGGKFFRFIYEVGVDDLVVYPALQDKTVYIGAILSKYTFVARSPFPHRRLVQWKFMVPNREFSNASRYEFGAARTFFEFKNNADDLLSKIADRTVTRFRSKAKAK
jgi:hypothetical protein